MKIGINSYMLERDSSGIEIYTKKIINGLIKNNIDLELYSYSGLNKNKEYKDYLKSSNLDVEISQLKKLYWNQYGIKKLVSPEVDVFFAPSFILPYGLSKKVKKVITVHDLAFLRFPEYTTLKEKLFYKLTLDYSLKHADKIIAISNSTQTDIEEFFPKYKSKVIRIYNGFEEYNKKERNNLILDKYKLINNKFFLTVGTLHKRKNIENTIKAFEEISKRYNDYKLVIVGKDGKKIKDKFNIINNNIIFTGYISDSELASLYSNAYLFLFLSYYEGFGFPVLESMSCNTPVLVSNSSSLPEISGYEKSLLVDPYNINDVVKGIENLIENTTLYSSLIEHSKIQIKKFSWEKMVNETINVFKKL